ncbi:MAG: MFS transporter [Chloroflexi bacterium]|nr:MFS transporter [Chloroflexota bacterium]
MPGDAIHFAILRNRPFLLLWSAQAISQTAQNVITFALLIEVGQISHSSMQASLVVLSFIVPAVVFGPVAGVFVDRSDKRKVLMVTNFLRAATVLAYIVADLALPASIILLTIYLLSVAFSTISQFFAPAEAATIPLLVEREQLAAANSLFGLTFTSSQLVGFALLGPLLIKLTTLRFLVVVVASLYLVCTLLVASLPALPQGAWMVERGNLFIRLRRAWGEIYELWVFVTREAAVAAAIIDFGVVASIFLMLGTLGVGLLTRVIGLPASDLSYVLASGGIGTLLGLLLVPRVLGIVDGRTLIDVGLGAMGVAILGMAGVHTILNVLLSGVAPESRATLTLVIVMFLATGLGVGSALVSVPAQTLLQQWSPASLRGRVFAALFTLSSALAILPVFFSGALADIIGLQKVMALIGLSTIALGARGCYSRMLERS